MPKRNQNVQKPKNMKSAFSKLIAYCRKELPIILVALVLAAFGAVLTIMGPDQISKITDYIYDGLASEINLEGIQKVAMRLLCIYLVSALCSFAQHFIMATVTQIIS